MFDRYVREVVAEPIVPDSAVRRLYNDRIDQFVAPEKVKVRHIFISLEDKRTDQALEAAQRIFSELQAHRVSYHADTPEGRAAFAAAFAAAARKYSDDPNAKDGGDLGWITRGQRDPKFEDAAFTVPAGVMSGIVGTEHGYHFILVEEKQAAGVIPYEEVRRQIREAMLANKQSEIMAAVSRITTELRAKSSVEVYAATLD
jgi:parvulin-like peptidyl-prolyl isomerase